MGTELQETNRNLQKPTSDVLLTVLEQLSSDQKRFIIARQEHTTDKAAAEALGLRPRLIYEWRVKGAPIDDALRLMADDGLVMATHLRRKALAKAMAVKVGGLDSDEENTRQKVSTEIIEWEMGRATQPTTSEYTGEITVRWIDDWRNTAPEPT